MADEDRKKLDPGTLDPDSLEVDELDQSAGGAEALTPETNNNCGSCTCPPPIDW